MRTGGSKWLAAVLAISAMVTTAGATPGPTTTSWWEQSPWDDPERGFNWYPDPIEAKPKQEPKAPEPKPKTIYEMTTLSEIQKELERLKAVAVVNPTEKNVLEFLKAQNFIMDKSSVFADVSRRVVWTHPEVDYNARRSVANFSITNQRQRDNLKRGQLMANLAETHGLVFFSRSDCGYCKDQAVALKRFHEDTKIPILPISLDGGAVHLFPDAKPDNGIAMLASRGEGIQTVPAVFLINRATRELLPLGAGVVAADNLAERIRVLTTTTPGQEF